MNTLHLKRLALVGIGISTLFSAFGQPIAAHTQGDGHKTFLPALLNLQATTRPPATPTSVTPSATPPPGRIGGVFPQRDRRTTSAAMVVDKSGGMHIAYAGYGPLNEKPPAYYAFCAADRNCADPAAWGKVALGQYVIEVQIALTAAGQPRLLYRIDREESLADSYVYATCDTNCTQTDPWTETELTSTSDVNPADWDLPQRFFALDPEDRPRYIYITGGPGDPRKGTYYVYCDDACTNAENWSETRIDRGTDVEEEIVRESVLTFTRAGQPRVLAMIFSSQQDSGVYYLACDNACDKNDSWQRVFVIERGFGPLAAWDLELDSADRPRLVIYQESDPKKTGDSNAGDILIYGWCQSDCLNGAAWSGHHFGLARNDGETPDLELDSLGRPRIAYHRGGADGGLGLAWCDSACESPNGVWKAQVVEGSSVLDASFPIPIPTGCDQASWSGGFRPSLALDARGDIRVGTDALRLMRCFYTDPSDPSKPPISRIETYQHTRFVFVPQPK